MENIKGLKVEKDEFYGEYAITESGLILKKGFKSKEEAQQYLEANYLPTNTNFGDK